MKTFARIVLGTLISAAALLPIAHAQVKEAAPAPYAPKPGQQGKDVIWLPTAEALVDRMLELADLQKSDYLIDLGSGDGRTVITAAKRGARAHGIEYDADLVAYSKRQAKAEGVEKTATFERGDIFETDFSKATVVTLFLLPDLNLRLRPTLLDMKPGTRIVSNSFDMGDWVPDDQVSVYDDCQSFCDAYKWIVPAKVEGTWMIDGHELKLTQTYQMVEGTYNRFGKDDPIRYGRLNGKEIVFTVNGERFGGIVEGDSMRGKRSNGQSWSGVRHKK